MRTLVAVLFCLSVCACAREPESAHTVDEYRADRALRQAQMERCASDPGTLRSTPDCINAKAASASEDRTSLREAPPVGLERKEAPASKPADPRAE